MVDHPSIDVIREIQDDGRHVQRIGPTKIVSQHFVPFHRQWSMNAEATEVPLPPSTRSARKCEALGDKVIQSFLKLSRAVQFDDVPLCLSQRS